MTDNTNETLGELPPLAPPHGWLEQFETLTSESFQQLEEVVKAGLQPAENELLIRLAAKLIQYASIHDADAVDKVLGILHPQL